MGKLHRKEEPMRDLVELRTERPLVHRTTASRRRHHRGSWVRYAAVHALLAGLLGLGAGCSPEPDRLWIERIQVANEDDGIFSFLEIEVHLFDHATRKHLGCARLESVDEADRTYPLEEHFVHDWRDPVDPSELFGREVVIEVIEDDMNPCPAPPMFVPNDPESDDPVGTSTPIAGDALGTTGTLRFDDVTLLVLAVHP